MIIQSSLLADASAGEFRSPSARRRRFRLPILSGLVALVLVGGAAAQVEAADLLGSFRGNAYATFANVQAGIVAAQLGRSAFQGCPCQGTDGKTLSNEVDSLQAGNNGDVLTANVTLSTVYTEKTRTTAEVQNTSTITGLNMLSGLITADTIEAVANVSATSTTMTHSSAGSNFVNLTIAGQSISGDVKRNTVYTLPGIGSVTLYKVTNSGTYKKSGQLLVEMLTVNVTQQNNFGLAIGAKIVVAHAVVGFNRAPLTVVFGGQAYAALANDQIGNLLVNEIGKAAFVMIGCEGTSRKTKTNNINTLDVGNVLTIGDGVTTAFGGPEGVPDVATTTAKIENLGILNGLITATAITAVAQQSIQDGVVTNSTAGSGFAGLTVAGVSIPINLPPNTKLALPLIGYVIVNQQFVTKSGRVSVNGLHIFVTTVNLLGLPVGSELVVAHADATVEPF